MTLCRRSFLAGVASLGLGLPFCAAQASEVDTADLLLSLLDDRDKAAALGSTWLEQRDHMPDSVALLNELVANLRLQGWNGDADRDALRNALAATVADDYRSGALVTISGWQIAKTQAELCALAYFATTGRL